MPRSFRLLTNTLAGVALLFAACCANASTYEVGPGMRYATIGSVPWSKLAPGDVVQIHWQPNPYREFVLISTSGTAAHHIVISGVADPATGQLPVIDGQNAVQSPMMHYHDEASTNPILFRLGL